MTQEVGEVRIPPIVAVVVPTYNEADNLPVLYERLMAIGIDGLGFVIVDDGSPDGTGDVADELAAGHDGYFRVIHRQLKQGLGRAYVAGFQAALDDGAGTVVEMDADLSHPPEELPAMLDKLRDADIVVGSRYVAGGGVDPDWSVSRRLLSSLGNTGIRLLVGVRVRDATAGFKAFRREALETIRLESMRISGFGFQAEVALACERAGLRVVEHPYTFMERTAGASKMSMGMVVEAAWRLLPLRFIR